MDKVLSIFFILLFSCSPEHPYRLSSSIEFGDFFEKVNTLEISNFHPANENFQWINDSLILFNNKEQQGIFELKLRSQQIEQIGQNGFSDRQYQNPDQFYFYQDTIYFTDIVNILLKKMSLDGKIKVVKKLKTRLDQFVFLNTDIYSSSDLLTKAFLTKNDSVDIFKKEACFKTLSRTMLPAQGLTLYKNEIFLMNPYEVDKLYRYNNKSGKGRVYKLALRLKDYSWEKWYQKPLSFRERYKIYKRQNFKITRIDALDSNTILLLGSNKETFLYHLESQELQELVEFKNKGQYIAKRKGVYCFISESKSIPKLNFYRIKKQKMSRREL